jgi:hypothetical protein
VFSPGGLLEESSRVNCAWCKFGRSTALQYLLPTRLHCRQTDANFQYFYGTNSPSLLPTSLSSSHSSKPLASCNNLLLHYTHILICHLVSLSCGITEHLRGGRACFFPPRTSIARLRIQYTAGRSPTYHHPESLSKPQRPEEFSNT